MEGMATAAVFGTEDGTLEACLVARLYASQLHTRAFSLSPAYQTSDHTPFMINTLLVRKRSKELKVDENII